MFLRLTIGGGIIKFANKRSVDFVGFLGVFPRVGRKKIDKQIIDEKGSIFGEKLYGEDAGYSFRDGSFGGAMMGGSWGLRGYCPGE